MAFEAAAIADVIAGLVGAGAEFFDEDEVFGSGERRASEAVGDHHGAEIVDGGGVEFAGETTDVTVVELTGAVVVGEVVLAGAVLIHLPRHSAAAAAVAAEMPALGIPRTTGSKSEIRW